MAKITFEEAINEAEKELKKIQKQADKVIVEQAFITDDNKFYEITFSYEIPPAPGDDQHSLSGIEGLSFLLTNKRIYKTFLIDALTGEFKGFKIFRE